MAKLDNIQGIIVYVLCYEKNGLATVSSANSMMDITGATNNLVNLIGSGNW